jgi:protein-S-isoprenylcysteine O-methyltransferase Ste14
MLAISLVAIVLLGVVAAVVPEWLDRWDPLFQYRGPTMLTFGALLMCVGAIIAWRAQHDMGPSWRVGIDPTESLVLVTGGLFRFCRNPIYLGLQIGMCGFFNMVPTCMTGALLAVALTLFQVQARLEEAHLWGQHGDAYADYCRRVGRFLPWTGRFADFANPNRRHHL